MTWAPIAVARIIQDSSQALFPVQGNRQARQVVRAAGPGDSAVTKAECFDRESARACVRVSMCVHV